jgi:hypothetical protein
VAVVMVLTPVQAAAGVEVAATAGAVVVVASTGTGVLTG